MADETAAVATEAPKAKRARKASTKTAKGRKTSAKKSRRAAKADPNNPFGILRERYQSGIYVKDSEHKTAGGNASVHNNDAVAKKLLGKELDEVYAIVAKACDVTAKSLKDKYGHLNLGMQRMNLGNKLRGAMSK